ncbi:Uncharacterised protein [uncultured Clostridium sp.]|nr:Uncharacterised protein [uncultured Clostridium sp.]
MELYRLKELIELSKMYVQIGFTELDAIIRAEKELTNGNTSAITNI